MRGVGVKAAIEREVTFASDTMNTDGTQLLAEFDVFARPLKDAIILERLHKLRCTRMSAGRYVPISLLLACFVNARHSSRESTSTVP